MATVAKKQQTETAVRPVESLVKALAAETGVSERSPADVMADVIDQIMTADSFDALFSPDSGKLVASQDLEDVPLRVESVEFRESSAKFKAGGLGSFVIAQVVNLETGEALAMGSGAPKVVAKLWKARQAGWLPAELVIRGKETPNGTVLDLEAVRAPR